MKYTPIKCQTIFATEIKNKNPTTKTKSILWNNNNKKEEHGENKKSIITIYTPTPYNGTYNHQILDNVQNTLVVANVLPQEQQNYPISHEQTNNQNHHKDIYRKIATDTNLKTLTPTQYIQMKTAKIIHETSSLNKTSWNFTKLLKKPISTRLTQNTYSNLKQT